MSKWVRGIYNSAANFNLSNALRATSMGNMDRNEQLMRKEHEQSNKCKQSSQSDKPSQSNNECGSDTDCLGCAPFSCAKFDPNSNHYIGDDTATSTGNENGIISKHY